MTPRTWPELLEHVTKGQDLTQADTAWAMDQIMGGNVSPVQLAGFLTALTTKGESAEEILGLAQSMRAHAEPTNLTSDSLDLVGTGGDRFHTVNISTMAAIVAAAGGIKVVKHGNRASSSASGSADCLEALGVSLDLDIDAIEKNFDELGITFLFANKFHPSMKHAAQARRELGVTTVFNILGPLTNPACPNANAIGVASEKFAPLMADVLAKRGSRGLVFRGENGLDELSTIATNHVWEIREGNVTFSTFDAVAELGLPPATIEDLRGGDCQFNADVARRVFAGEKGHVRDAVMLNAAAAFVADARGDEFVYASAPLTERFNRGLERAKEAIDSGAASELVERWVALSSAASV